MGGILARGVWIFLVLALMSFIVSAQEIPLTSCTQINQSGSYRLVNDIYNTSFFPCFFVTAHNVSVNCAGRTIAAQNEAFEILYAQNVTVKNCNITILGFSGSAGIYGISSGLIARNNTITIRGGIGIGATSQSTIEDNVITVGQYGGSFGIAMSDGNNVIRHNTITSPNGTAMGLDYLSDNVFEYNTVRAGALGVVARGARNNISFNDITVSFGPAILIGAGRYPGFSWPDNIISNTIRTNTSYFITFLQEGSPSPQNFMHVIENNTGNGKPILYYNNIHNRTFDFSEQNISGVIIANSDKVHVTNARLSEDDGFQLYYVSDSVFENAVHRFSKVTPLYTIIGDNNKLSNLTVINYSGTFGIILQGNTNVVVASNTPSSISVSGNNNLLSSNMVFLNVSYLYLAAIMMGGVNNTISGNTVYFDGNNNAIAAISLGGENNSINSNNISVYNSAVAIRLSSSHDVIFNNKISSVGESALISSDGMYSVLYNNLFNTSSYRYLRSDRYANHWNATLRRQRNIVGGPYIGGNYYARSDGSGFSEQCPDANRDGICDSSLVHGIDNTDFLPLAKPPTTSRPVVLLVHGIYSNDQIWNSLEGNLTQSGFDVYLLGRVLEKEGFIPNNGDIRLLGFQLRDAINRVKAQTGASKVNIVAHSMGGLVTRFYMRSNLYQNDINKLITLGTPNEGTPMARHGLFASVLRRLTNASNTIPENHNTARFQMLPNTTLLQYINGNFENRGVAHSEIAGTLTNPLATRIERSFRNTTTDSIVPRASVNIPGIACYERAVTHAAGLGPNYYYNDQITIMSILMILSDQTPPLSECPEGERDEPEPEGSFQLATIERSISPSEQQMVINAQDLGRQFDAVINWSTGQIDLEFISPSGVIVNRSTYSQYPGVSYAQHIFADMPIDEYRFASPERGNWSITVRATNIPEPLVYVLTLLTETPFRMETRTDETTYAPGQPVIITTKIMNTTTPALNATVSALIGKPDSSSTVIGLFDDGLHNDTLPNDGTYGNVFNETSQDGVYLVDINASLPNVFGFQERTSFFVELFPDLKVDEQDITMTPSSLTPGENATINVQAIIHNIGEKDAANATIEFYNGDPSMNGIKFGNVTLDIPVNQSIVASASLPVAFVANASLASEGAFLLNSTINLTILDTALRSRDIHVIISPFAPYLESNYTNNQAKKPLRYADVTYVVALSFGTVPGIPLGDGRVIPLNFDELLLLSVQYPQSVGFSNSIGFLDPLGRARASLTIPFIPELRGLPLYVGFVTIYPAAAMPFVSISNAVQLRIS